MLSGPSLWWLDSHSINGLWIWHWLRSGNWEWDSNILLVWVHSVSLSLTLVSSSHKLSLEILCYISHLPWSRQVSPSSACHFHLAVHGVKHAHLALTIKWHYLASFIFGYTHVYHCQRDQFCHSIYSQPQPAKEEYTKLLSDAFLTSVILIVLVNKVFWLSLST